MLSEEKGHRDSSPQHPFFGVKATPEKAREGTEVHRDGMRPEAEKTPSEPETSSITEANSTPQTEMQAGSFIPISGCLPTV